MNAGLPGYDLLLALAGWIPDPIGRQGLRIVTWQPSPVAEAHSDNRNHHGKAPGAPPRAREGRQSSSRRNITHFIQPVPDYPE
jgi:hypothetical protein